jgi:hypothetical protein
MADVWVLTPERCFASKQNREAVPNLKFLTRNFKVKESPSPAPRKMNCRQFITWLCRKAKSQVGKTYIFVYVFSFT